MAKKREGGSVTGGGPAFVYVSVAGFVYPEPLSTGQRRWLCWIPEIRLFRPRLWTIMTRELLAHNRDKEYRHSLDAAFGYPKDICYGNGLF